MECTLVDIRALAERFEELAQQIAEALETSPLPAADPTPEQLCAAMRELEDTLIVAGDPIRQPSPTDRELRTFGGHGARLCRKLAELATRLQLTEIATELRGLPWGFAVWMVRHDAEIEDLDPFVQALAAHTQRLGAPDEFAHLHAEVNEVLAALCPRIEERVEGFDPPRAWRQLIVQQAIVAIRSGRPALMRAAFDSILEKVPHNASSIFEEGMREMERLGHPPQVREIVESYFQKFGSGLRLH